MMDTGELAACFEPEAGAEILLCPILGLPIVRSQRVRTLPGFHLLSLAAGREALARGSYQAYGSSHPCNDLEYLHQEDKVFVCGEDHKAFLNQMSMQYHRYIRHELAERKAERKRLRERATERQARSLAHKQQKRLALTGPPETLQHQQQQQQQPPPQQPQQPQPQVVAAVAAPPTTSLDPYGAAAAAAGTAVSSEAPAPVAVDDQYASASEDPYAIGPEAEVAAREPAAPTPAPRASTALAVVAPAVDTQEDDLYGDVEGPVKRQKNESTYASAIGAMFDGDFDEDE